MYASLKGIKGASLETLGEAWPHWSKTLTHLWVGRVKTSSWQKYLEMQSQRDPREAQPRKLWFVIHVLFFDIFNDRELILIVTDESCRI